MKVSIQSDQSITVQESIRSLADAGWQGGILAVLIDYISTLRKRGVPLDEAIVKGGRTRLKPISMSVSTTLLGMVPLAIGLGTGSELQTPMGRAVFGGLLSSTLVTLVLIPTLYFLVERAKERWGKVV